MKQPFFFSFVSYMAVKDHYKILELPVQASAAAIKQAYRRLARQFHPDKNNNDERATRIFQEIQTAYEILSNPARRKTYDNELKHAGQYSAFNKDHIVSSEQIIKQSKDLLRYINSMNQRSINYDALTDFILGILNKENMALLLRANDAANNDLITFNIIQASKGILAIRSFAEIARQLELLHPDEHSDSYKIIRAETNLRVKREEQNKLVPYAAFGIILLVIIIMCCILFIQ